MFLSDEEVETLTGYIKPSSQSKWLWENSIPHYTNAQGKVIVVRAALEKTPEIKVKEPRFDHVA